jgi:hypothetical protein
MSSSKPTAPATTESREVPALPAGHPLESKLAAWVQLRDQLADLSAHLEYLNLMLRLEKRKG